MGVNKFIYDSKDLTTLSDDILKRIDRAVIAAAYKVRDDMRQVFISSSSLYKHKTGNLSHLAEGIEVGKLNNSQVKIHSLGSKDKYDTYKTRFFVGGTIPRTQTKRNGKNIKPYSKGYIQANNAIDIGFSQAEKTLNTFINNVLEN
jgi:hypothetical protein